MSNRRKIEKFCKQNNLKLLKCEFHRNRDAEYGDSWDVSFWHVTVEKDNYVVEYQSERYQILLADDVDTMLEEILKDIKTGYFKERGEKIKQKSHKKEELK